MSRGFPTSQHRSVFANISRCEIGGFLGWALLGGGYRKVKVCCDRGVLARCHELCYDIVAIFFFNRKGLDCDTSSFSGRLFLLFASRFVVGEFLCAFWLLR